MSVSDLLSTKAPSSSSGTPSEVTELPSAKEKEFQAWAKKFGLTDVDHPDSHYDYRGAFLAGLKPGQDAHWPDTFKQHGHPTFSVESQYSKGPNDGGHWNGDVFVPAQQRAAGAPDQVSARETSALEYGQTAAEGLASGALDAFTAVPRMASGALSKAFGVKDPLAGISGRGFLSDVAAVTQGAETGSQYEEDQRGRAARNPGTATASTIAGQVAGAALSGAGGLARGAGAVATEGLGGGLVARLLGAGAAGAVEGAPLGYAGASDAAYLQKQQLDGEHAVAAAGLGALLGSGLRLGGAAVAEAAGAGARAVGDAAARFTGDATETAPGTFDPSIYQAKPAASGPVEEAGNFLKKRVAAKAIHAAIDFLPIGGAGRFAARQAVHAMGGEASEKLVELATKAGTMAVDAVTAAAPVAAAAASKTASVLTTPAIALFTQGHETPEDAYAAHIGNLQDLAANGGAGIRNKVVASLGPLASSNPAALTAAQQTADRGVQYLLSIAPTPPLDTASLTPLSSKPKVSRAQAIEWGQSWTDVMHPERTLAAISRGTVATQQMKTLRLVYPSWADVISDAAAAQLRKLDASGKPLTEPQRRTFDIVLGLDGASDALSSPQFVARYGPKMGDSASSGKDAAQPKGAPSKGNPKFLASYRTTTDSILGATTP